MEQKNYPLALENYQKSLQIKAIFKYKTSIGSIITLNSID
jgi:hypothetical protein